MRKILVSILLASAAASPVVAQDHDTERRAIWGDHQESHPDKSQAREERSQTREQVRIERQVTSPPHPQLEMRQQQDQTTGRGAQRADGVSRWTRDSVQQAGETSRWTRDPNQRPGETARWTRDRAGETRTSGNLRQPDRPLPNVMRTRNPLVVSATPHEGTQPPLRIARHSNQTSHWSTDWRNNGRYDWRGWRDRNRSRFHLSVYYDPFGWGYRPYRIGWRLWPSYYGSSYWISDPWAYRLPYAPPGTRWIRYWDDALLVDTWTGEVIDVIQNFFW